MRCRWAAKTNGPKRKKNITCPGILAPQSKPALGQIWKKSSNQVASYAFGFFSWWLGGLKCLGCLGMSWFGRFWVPSATVKDARLVVAPRLTVHRDNHWALTAEERKTWKTWTRTRQNWYLAGTLHSFQDLFRPNAWRKCACRTKAPSQPNAVAANQVFSKVQNSQKLTIAAQ